jgi:hypothetical protein
MPERLGEPRLIHSRSNQPQRDWRYPSLEEHREAKGVRRAPSIAPHRRPNADGLVRAGG